MGSAATLHFQRFLAVSFIILLVLPVAVIGDCTCDRGEKDGHASKSEALRYKIAAIASILAAGTLGVLLPVLGKTIPALRPEKDVFFLIKAFAAGVILATGFVHILPDAFENLTSPCLSESPWGDFPFTGFIAMLAAIGTLTVDAFATSYYWKAHLGRRETMLNGQVAGSGGDEEEDRVGHVHVHTHATHGHSHGMAESKDSGAGASELLLRHRVISQVLELGIIVHSVIIGISLGASESLKSVRPLVAALTFHQFFEGMGLGGCISQANFKGRAVALMMLFFSLTTPVGIAIGIGISNVYDENSSTALIVEGIFNAAAAGILIYMALVDLLSADFMNPRVQSNGKLQLGVNASLLLGTGAMSLLAKWA